MAVALHHGVFDAEDVCGVSFNEESLEQRLQRTKFLYPKHVEAIDDLAPIADAMVDNIIRCVRICVLLRYCVDTCGVPSIHMHWKEL